MKPQPVLLALLAVLTLTRTANTQAQATNPPYIREFPSAERIRAEVKGADAMETAARQMGAFWQLSQLVYDLAWATQRRYRDRITPDEARVIAAYNAGYAAASEPYEAIQKTPSNPDRQKWSRLKNFFAYEPGFLDDLLKQFFSAQFRSGYYRVTGKRPPPPFTAQPPVGQPAAQPSAPAGGSADAYLAEGMKYQDAEDYAKAIAAYKKAIALKPGMSDAYKYLGFCYFRLKQYQNALPALREAVRLKPGEYVTQYLLGVTFFKLQRYQEALAAAQEAARLKPDDPNVHYLIGDVYADGLKQYEKAVPEYREAVKLQPDDAQNHNKLALTYHYLDEYEDAVAEYQQAVRLQPDDADYRYNLGDTYLEMGRKEEALRVYQALHKIDPAKAEELKKEIEVFPSDDAPDDLLSVARIADFEGHPGAALPLYRRVVLLKPRQDTVARAYQWMGDALKELGKAAKATASYQQALAIYRQQIKLKPKDADLYDGLGRTYLGLGQREQALQAYRTLRTLDRKQAQELYEEINKR